MLLKLSKEHPYILFLALYIYSLSSSPSSSLEEDDKLPNKDKAFTPSIVGDASSSESEPLSFQRFTAGTTGTFESATGAAGGAVPSFN